MSATKDFFMTVVELHLDFQSVIERIFRNNGYDVLFTASEFDRPVPDIVFLKDGKRVIVEVKVYYSSSGLQDNLRNACVALDMYAKEHGASKAILATPVSLPDEVLYAEWGTGIEIWDIKRLLKESGRDADIKASLLNIAHEIRLSNINFENDQAAGINQTESDGLEDREKGFALALQLENIIPGPADARVFENLCMESLQYLFRSEFKNWKSQSQIDGGFQRVDLIARLVPTHEFWQSISHDFRARYIVFEFKNYTDQIGQNQVYLTEKYLFPAALRPVAFIFSRNGHDKGAKRAVQAALRGHGKLILCLSMAELCEMLRGKANGDDPTGIIIDHYNEVLTDLAP